MKLTVLGIAVVGVGTYLTFIDKWRVAGVVVIALGTLLMYLAQRRDSTSDAKTIHAAIDKRLTEFQREITQAKALPAPEAAVKLNQIDREFTEWAAAFVKNKDRRKLEVEQRRVAVMKSELDRSEVWRPVMELVLRTIAGAVRAYASQTGMKVEVHLPQLPSNLFDKSVEYTGKVVFREDVAWLLQLDRDMDALSEFPSMWVSLSRAKRNEPRMGYDSHLLHVWSMNRGADFVHVSVFGDILPRLSGMEGVFTTSNYQDGLRKALLRLVEAQILYLEENAVRR
jgi:hypothetical protein